MVQPPRRALERSPRQVALYSGITLPLTFSFARRAYEEVYRSFCRVMGVPRRVIDESEQVYANMLGLIRGRVYYNLLSWYRLIAMLPGYKYNRRYMEQMMGVNASLSEELSAAIGTSRSASGPADWARLVVSIAGMIRNYFGLPGTIRGFYARLNGALAIDKERLAQMPVEELAAYYRTLQARLLRKWDAPIVNDFLAMIFHGVLRTLCTKWIDAADQSLHNDLVRGVGGVISVEPGHLEFGRTAVPHGTDESSGVAGDLDASGLRNARDVSVGPQ